MDAPMTRETFLESLRGGRSAWGDLLAEIGADRMVEPGVEGDWSVKDIVAHVTWHEREMLGILQARALVGSDLWNLPLDQRNAAIFEQNKNRTLNDVLEESRQISPQLLELAEDLSNEELNDPRRFSGMPEDWSPAGLIADNTFVHYRDHIASIRTWLDRTKSRD
jgi:uncharacterized damage-inducible protein DinB